LFHPEPHSLSAIGDAPSWQTEAIKRRDAGEPIREIARTYNVYNSTISRLAA
jgi:hypothetical protein